jgi:pSer/pThr/pTyr-binding forkhead associated (FHA) protein
MHVTSRPSGGLANVDVGTGAMQATMNHDLEIVLKPLSRPDLGEIRISDGVFAVGRNEQPFASYDPDILVMLSRRHARIFCERDAVYLADLESRNGTTVNRAGLAQAPSRLNDGDEICFGGVLSYRVQITSRAAAARPKGVTLTLTPAAAGSDLEPIVIARFPFLVSKSDATFARYRAAYPKQLEFLSRRQAHVFLKGGEPHIEDLASTNGTFLDGERLQEHAVPLHDGMLLAFGGEHFVYRVGVEKSGAFDADPTRDGMAAGAGAAVDAKPVNPGKTTFVAVPDSFLDIFCAETQMADSAEPAGPAAAAASAAAPEPAKKSRPRGRVAALVSELATVLAGGERKRVRRNAWVALAVVATLGASGFGLSWWVRSERALKDMIERGEYAQAALKADQALQREPDDVELKALSTEAALKAKVPEWLGKLAARDFDGARAVAAELGEFGKRNPELLPLAGELEWLGSLEQLVIGRGPDTPIRIYADEDKIAAVIERWNRDTREHQRSLGRIASYVPQFGGPYAEALTRLRKLQSDATVYLGAIERLKASIAGEMARDRPENLQSVLKDYADKYPGLGGLDAVQRDLARYIDIRREARARKPGRLFSLMLKSSLVTPPFRDSLQAMAGNGQLPTAAIVRQYEVSTQAWKDGQVTPALAGLRSMVTGAWAEAAATELQRKQAVVDQFAALQASRAAADHADRLIAFRESLDADEDAFFARTTQADLDQQRDKVVARAQGLTNRARALWQDYRSGGAIDASLRIETSISNRFRNQARLLSEARQAAQRGAEIYALIGVSGSDPSVAIRDEINTEAQAQRSALLELRNVLDPALVRDKLVLLGEGGE